MAEFTLVNAMSLPNYNSKDPDDTQKYPPILHRAGTQLDLEELDDETIELLLERGVIRRTDEDVEPEPSLQQKIDSQELPKPKANASRAEWLEYARNAYGMYPADEPGANYDSVSRDQIQSEVRNAEQKAGA